MPEEKRYSVVAMKPGKFPGAYASCMDAPEWLGDFAIRELRAGATLRRVTSRHAHELLGEYLAWCDQQDKAKAEMKRVSELVTLARHKALAKPIPRNECPGCFSAIYEGAAEQGWCCDCYPKRKEYETDTSAAIPGGDL